MINVARYVLRPDTCAKGSLYQRSVYRQLGLMV